MSKSTGKKIKKDSNSDEENKSDNHDDDHNDDDDGDDDENDSSEEGTKVISNELKDRVISYVKIDDIIRQKKEEIKELTNKLKPCSEYIINFLDKKDIDYVNINGGKLIKSESETKAPLKPELIKEVIKEHIQSKKLAGMDGANDASKFSEEILALIEAKRAIQKKTNIRRAFAKEPKKKAVKKAK